MFVPNITFSSAAYEISDSLKLEFIAKYPNTLSINEKYIIDISLYEMVLDVKKRLQEWKIEDLFFNGLDSETISLQGDGIYICFTKRDGRVTQSRKGIVTVEITAFPSIIQPLLEQLDSLYQLHQQGQLELWYNGKNGPTYLSVLINPIGIFHTEFYPWLPTDFMDEYMASTASVLFLTGLPGTGKTSV